MRKLTLLVALCLFLVVNLTSSWAGSWVDVRPYLYYPPHSYTLNRTWEYDNFCPRGSSNWVGTSWIDMRSVHPAYDWCDGSIKMYRMNMRNSCSICWERWGTTNCDGVTYYPYLETLYIQDWQKMPFGPGAGRYYQRRRYNTTMPSSSVEYANDPAHGEYWDFPYNTEWFRKYQVDDPYNDLLTYVNLYNYGDKQWHYMERPNTDCYMGYGTDKGQICAMATTQHEYTNVAYKFLGWTKFTCTNGAVISGRVLVIKHWFEPTYEEVKYYMVNHGCYKIEAYDNGVLVHDARLKYHYDWYTP